MTTAIDFFQTIPPRTERWTIGEAPVEATRLGDGSWVVQAVLMSASEYRSFRAAFDSTYDPEPPAEEPSLYAFCERVYNDGKQLRSELDDRWERYGSAPEALEGIAKHGAHRVDVVRGRHFHGYAMVAPGSDAPFVKHSKGITRFIYG